MTTLDTKVDAINSKVNAVIDAMNTKIDVVIGDCEDPQFLCNDADCLISDQVCDHVGEQG